MDVQEAKMKKTVLALALSLSLAAANVQAETISFNFSGTWGSVASSKALSVWFPLGGAFTGSISYLEDAVATANSDGSASYAGASMTFMTTDWACNVLIPEVKIFNGVTDQFVVRFPVLNLSGSSLSFVPSDAFKKRAGFEALPGFLWGEFSLKDDQGEAFSSIDLPSTGIMNAWPMAFDFGMLNLYFLSPSIQSVQAGPGQQSFPTVSGRINTHPTPEPATFLLFATGMTGLAAYRRRRIS